MHSHPARVLVTGLAGFTGTYLRLTLERAGYEVHGTVRSGELVDARHHRAELTDVSALREVINRVVPLHVVHLAAISFVAHDDVASIYNANIVGTHNLLSALADSAATSSLKTVLLASSANVYGNTTANPIRENEPYRPANDYAVSKAAMEQMAALWSTRLPITVVRPFNYTGAGQSIQFLIPKIVNAFARREPSLELGNLDVHRDFSDVRDVVTAYAQLLEVSPCSTFNICSERTHTLREIISMVSELSDHQLDIQVNPKFVRANEVKTLCGSAEKLKTIVPGWGPRPLRDTLRWMLEAARSGGA